MTNMQNKEKPMPWIGVLLALSLVAFLLQISPSLFQLLFSWSDVRDWSRSTWFVANLVLVLFFVGIRFGPEILDSLKKPRSEKLSQQERAKKSKELKDRREGIKHIKAGHH